MNTNTTKRSINLWVVLLGIALVGLLVLLFTGCSTQTASTPDPKASSATQPESQTPPPVNNLLKQFGDTITWEDGLSVSVSEPTPFVPTPESMGSVEGQTHLVFEIVLTNGTDEPLEPIAATSASSGGVEASAIFDLGNGLGQVGYGPSTTILPGQSVKWLMAYSVADPADITFEVSPGFLYDSGLFTNIPF